MRHWKAGGLIAVVSLLLAMAAAPVGAVEWNSASFDGYLTPQTNPCDGSAVPERNGTTWLRIAEIARPGGTEKVLVGVKVEVAGGEYSTVLINEATFNESADSYTFGARSFTYRNGVLEFMSLSTQTVFMSGDQPTSHRIFGGPGSVCIRPAG
jgi:hypothetical protein